MIWFKKIMSIISCVTYSFDVYTDIYSVYIYYIYVAPDNISHDPFRGYATIYGHLTLTFILIPIIITALTTITSIIKDIDKLILTKILLVLAVCLCAPIIPIFFLVKNAIGLLRGHDPDSPAAHRAGVIKLIEALLEAFPQSALQLLVITRTIKIIGPFGLWWQWITLASSLITLSTTVASSTYLFDANILTRLTFWILGLMAFTARLMLSAGSWGYPALTLLGPAIGIWLLKRFCSCRFCLPLTVDHHRWATCHHPVITWMLTAFFNCFTTSGLLMATITLAWALVIFQKVMEITVSRGMPLLVLLQRGSYFCHHCHAPSCLSHVYLPSQPNPCIGPVVPAPNRGTVAQH
ncbi:unnamed protein product [Meganyctiphanes norvegica]|uniref:XK-related protein n=1 Tax=Meganyctiphanes norvegica TaxID=48144 RepID=A0AAV2SUY1_MEGNR